MDSEGEVQIFGRKVSRGGERKFLLIAGAAGIVGLLLIVMKNRAAATVVAPGSAPVGSSAPPATTGSSASGTGAESQALPTLHFSFTESTSPTIEAETGGSKSGSGGLNVFGLFSVGGGGSGSSSRHVKESVENVFSTDVTLTNATPTAIESLFAALEGLAGTQEQRAAYAQQEVNQAYSFLEPGHTIAGVIAHEQSQQSVENAQNQLKIDNLVHHPLVVR